MSYPFVARFMTEKTAVNIIPPTAATHANHGNGYGGAKLYSDKGAYIVK